MTATSRLSNMPLQDKERAWVWRAPSGYGNQRRPADPDAPPLLTQWPPHQSHSPGGPDQPPGGPAVITSLPGGELFHVSRGYDPAVPLEPSTLPASCRHAQLRWEGAGLPDPLTGTRLCPPLRGPGHPWGRMKFSQPSPCWFPRLG